MIKIRVFKAVDDIKSCQKFIEGHMKILKVFGITMITSANIDWFIDPYTYVIIVESIEGDKVFGGARIQIAGGKNPLPIESAICELDENFHTILNDYKASGTAEVCGLWNSREVAGLGIGSIFLTRTAVAIAPLLNIKSLWALCAPYTVEMAQKTGFEIAKFVGNDGTFYYPKDDLLATAVLINDTNLLDMADQEEKNEILSLRNNPIQIKSEKSRRGVVFTINFDLTIQKHETI